LASRTKSKCDSIAAELKRPIQTAAVDADNVPELVKLLNSFKPEVVINVALPYQDLTIMDACLEAGVHYIDTANYEPRDVAKFEYHWQWAYQEKYKAAGLTALLGCGFDPGVTNVYTAYALKHHFSSIDTLDIIDCNAGDHGKAFATNFNPEINLREVTANGRYWENGAWVETKPLEIKRSFDFPDGIGPKNIYCLYHEELESLTKHIPMRRARFWMTFGDNYIKHMEVLVNVGMTRIDPVVHKGVEIIPIEFLKTLLPEPGTLGADTKGKTCIGNWIEGTGKDGKLLRYYVYNIKDHEDCYKETNSQGVSYTTGVPAMIAAKQLLTNTEYRQPGVWNVEQLNPDPFMADLNAYGLPWVETYPTEKLPGE
ncbi:MAG: saccharopine dehydrogenase family protein, partial [Verrucomicrobiaceae bacterium]